MSPHNMGAQLQSLYPAKAGSRIQRWKRTLALGPVNDINPDTLLSKKLYQYAAEQLEGQVSNVINARYKQPDYDLQMTLRKNAAQFAAHKAAHFTAWMRDADGQGKAPLKRKFLLQLNVEKNLAARAAKQWNTFVRDQELYPHLEYRPSRSVNKREDHTRYYGMVLPVNHPFWNKGFPPNGWNCKCSVRNTDKKNTKAKKPPKTPKGIPGNAGKEQVIFTQQHPFFKKVNNKKRMWKEWMKLERTVVREWTQANIEGKAFASKKGQIHVNGTGVKKIIHQNHDFLWEKNRLLYDIKDVIKRARWVDTVEFDESKKGANRFDYVLYFEIKIQGKSNYLVVKKEKGGKMLLYSIVEKIK